MCQSRRIHAQRLLLACEALLHARKHIAPHCSLSIKHREAIVRLLCHLADYGPGDEIELTSLDVRFPFAALYKNAGVPEAMEDPEGEV